MKDDPEAIEVEIYEYEDSFKQLSVEGSSLNISISYDRKSVKMEDSAGNYHYFKSIDEVRKLKAMLEKLIDLNPPIHRD